MSRTKVRRNRLQMQAASDTFMLPSKSMDGVQSHLILEETPIHTDASYTEENAPEPIWKSDALKLPLKELRRKYPLTSNSFQNTVYGRGKGPNGEPKHFICPEVQDFRGFLLHFGPRRTSELTLDRTNNADPRYGPGLCAWRDRHEQARNRRSTIIVEHPETGDTVPLVQLAEEWEVDAQRLRRWHREGLSTREMRTRLFANDTDSDTSSGNGWPWRLDRTRLDLWERRYKRYRQSATEWGYELRSEFACRWLSDWLQRQINWITQTWENYVDPDPWLTEGLDGMPPTVREEFEKALEVKALLEERLAAAQEASSLIKPWAKRDPNPRDAF